MFNESTTAEAFVLLTPQALAEALTLMGWAEVPNKTRTFTKRMMWPPQGSHKTLQDVRILIEFRGVRLALKERVTPTETNPSRTAWTWGDYIPMVDIRVLPTAQLKLGQHIL